MVINRTTVQGLSWTEIVFHFQFVIKIEEQSSKFGQLQVRHKEQNKCLIFLTLLWSELYLQYQSQVCPQGGRRAKVLDQATCPLARLGTQEFPQYPLFSDIRLMWDSPATPVGRDPPHPLPSTSSPLPRSSR